MGKVFVVSPDGRRLEVDETSVPYLQKLDYRVEQVGERSEQLHQESVERRFSSAEQKLATFGEGVLSAASLGFADPLMDDYSTRKREEINPGTRAVGEVVGAIAPAVASGGTSIVSKVLGATPAGLLERGAVRAAAGVSSPVRRIATEGAVEGFGQATGQVLGGALSGDPVTVESAVTTIGVGTFLGYGVGALAGKGLKYLGKLPDNVTAKAGEKAGTFASNLVDEVDAVDPRRTLGDFTMLPEAQAYDKGLKGRWDDAKWTVDDRLASLNAQREGIIDNILQRTVDPGDLPTGVEGRNVASDTANIKTPGRRKKVVEQLRDEIVLDDDAMEALSWVEVDGKAFRSGKTRKGIGAANEARFQAAYGDTPPADDFLVYPNSLPRAEGLPGNFRRGQNVAEDAPIYKGLPKYDGVDEDAIYVASPRDLYDRGIDFGASGKAWSGDEVRLNKIRKGMAEGAEFDPIDVVVRRDGTFEVVGGRHRLVAAAEAGKPVAFRVGRGAGGADVPQGSARTTQKLPGSRKPTERMVREGDIVGEEAIPGPDKLDLDLTGPLSSSLRKRDIPEDLAREAEALYGPADDTFDITARFDQLRDEPIIQAFRDVETEIVRLSAARAMLNRVPDLSLQALRGMSPNQFANVTYFLDKLARWAPDAFKSVDDHIDAVMQKWIGVTDPGSIGFTPLEFAQRYGATREVIERMAGVHDKSARLGALWATVKDLDSVKVAKPFQDAVSMLDDDVAGAVSKANADAAQVKPTAPITPKGKEPTGHGRMGLMGGIIGRGAGRAGARLLGGGAVGGALGWALGWGAVESVVVGGGLAAGGGRISRMATRAKDRTFNALAKIVGGKGRAGAAAVVAANYMSPDLRQPQFVGDPGLSGDRTAVFKARRDQILESATPAGRNALADALAPVLSTSKKLGEAMREDVMRRVEYLAKHAPLDPPFVGMGGVGARWAPDPRKMVEWSQRYAVTMDPPKAIEAMAAGKLTPAMADAFMQTSPGLWSQVVAELSKHDLSKLPPPVQMSVSFLLNKPLGLMNQPGVVAAFQAPSEESAAAQAQGISPQGMQLMASEAPTAGQMVSG